MLPVFVSGNWKLRVPSTSSILISNCSEPVSVPLGTFRNKLYPYHV